MIRGRKGGSDIKKKEGERENMDKMNKETKKTKWYENWWEGRTMVEMRWIEERSEEDGFG